MKKFLVIFLFCLFFSLPVTAESVPETRMRPYSAAEDIDMERTLSQLLETAKFFDEKYPQDKIQEDMRSDIAAIFPALNEQQLYNFQTYIREGLSVYRYIKNIYEKYKQNLLTPEDPPLIVDDDQYVDFKQPTEYIDSGDNVVVVTDIKTIVPYSQNIRDIKSAQAKIKRNAQNSGTEKGEFDDLMYIASRMEWKKLPFYDIIYPSPLTGKKGIGSWTKKEEIKARIITEQTGVKDAKEVKGVLHVTLPQDKVVIANDGMYHKPEINFEHSENLKSWNLGFPMPVRLLSEDNADHTVYIREIAFPVTFEVEDTEKPLILRANLTIDACDTLWQCGPVVLTPELELASEYTRSSSVATFIYQNHVYQPSEKNDNIKITDMAVKELPDIGSFIEVTLTAKQKVSAFSVFISSPDNIAFEAPRINIDGKKITVRFLPTEKRSDLSAYIFEISVVLNKSETFRAWQLPYDGGMSTPLRPKLSWYLIITAFLGGLLLNFMPCVFPVLSIKLLSLTKFGARQNINVRRNFYYTLLGIAISFGALASFLALLKYLGRSIGWGMQFQNPYFVITMIFAILLFMLSISEIVTFRLPDKLQKYIHGRSPDSLVHLLTGVLAVLMSTPCTAPYLGTAIGFALSGSIADIYCIMVAVGLGLAFPYILIYVFPSLIILVPTPGPWMHKLNLLMFIMLFVTLIWLFSVLLAQTGTTFIIRLSVYILLAFVLLWLNSINRETEYPDLSLRQREKTRYVFSLIFISATALLYIISLIDGHFAHQARRQIVEEQTVSSISMETINNAVHKGHTVIVAVGADWCLTCKYNDATVLNIPSVVEKMNASNIDFIKVDWTNYNREVLDFMEKYRRSGLPFYILFSPLAPDGIVLPEILNENDFNALIRNFTLRPSAS